MKGYSDSDRTGIRVRFAPSPTGPLHAGNMRAAIFNWLFARRHKGKLILRMEDTDSQRSSMELADKIIEMLEWIGIDWDEGPFFQSQHYTLYGKVIDQLYGKGFIYPCFCSEEELERDRKEAESKSLPHVYPGRCRNLEMSEIEEKIGKEPFTFRFAVKGETIEYTDIIRGKIDVNLNLIGDFIVRRSDGSFTYNLAAAVDDAMMKITHVVRGEDHISNTPKQVLIIKALGYEKPVYAHLPLILASDGKKLSKREEGASLNDLLEKGYLPEAVFNFLALIGWSSEDKSEEMSRNDLIEKFSLERVATRPAQYDLGRLDWLNGLKMGRATSKDILEKGKGFIKEHAAEFGKLEKDRQIWLISAIRENINTLADLDWELRPFFDYNIAPEVVLEMAGFPAADVLEAFLLYCDREEFAEVVREITGKTGIKGKQLFMPLRAGLTGRLGGPELKTVYQWFKPNERAKRASALLEQIK